MTKLIFTLILIFSIQAQDFTYDVTLPEVSQKAMAMQRVGITDITITYSRPLVKGREIYGKLEKFGLNKTFTGKSIPWRAGANENTVLSFTHDVKIDGKEVKAGDYGFHIILNEKKWTVILSHNSTSWGSFYYDPSEDALRFDVTPKDVKNHELLTYRFDDVKPNSTTLTFFWEKKSFSFDIEVDVHKHVLANFRNEVRGLNGYGYRAWFQAAQYCLNNKINYEEALQWIDMSIRWGSNFQNNSVKGQLLIAMDKKNEGIKSLETALEMAPNDRVKTAIQKLIDDAK